MLINRILGVTESYKAPERMWEILKADTEIRNPIFLEFLEAFNYDVSEDWFHSWFQEDHADRSVKKQDFTPMSVGKLLAEITQSTGKDLNRFEKRYDVCSGTGGLTISKWFMDAWEVGFMDYRPSKFIYICEELSDRSLPFLLFNMMVRGMNGIIYHGDVLEQNYKAVYVVVNETDNALGFSGFVEITKRN